MDRKVRSRANLRPNIWGNIRNLLRVCEAWRDRQKGQRQGRQYILSLLLMTFPFPNKYNVRSLWEQHADGCMGTFTTVFIKNLNCLKEMRRLQHRSMFMRIGSFSSVWTCFLCLRVLSSKRFLVGWGIKTKKSQIQLLLVLFH